ncbi:MAG: hypothetical protein ACTSWX_03565 [Promethearchaeota archaeon]
MSEIKIVRYDPRKDKAALIELIKEFEYRSIYPIDVQKFSNEIENRVKDLKLRNSMILAKEEERIVGAGFFTLMNDYLGNSHCIIHDVVIRKEDSFKRGIEEKILRELFSYLNKTMKIDKVGFFIRRKDSNIQSLLMKLKIKKSELDYYEGEI